MNFEIIEKIRKFLDCGRVYYNKRTETWYLQIRAQNESEKLMNLIDGKFRTSHKKFQFEKRKTFVLNRTLKKRKWTNPEEILLIESIKQGKSYDHISKILNRTTLSVKSRNWRKFNIPYKYDFRKREL